MFTHSHIHSIDILDHKYVNFQPSPLSSSCQNIAFPPSPVHPFVSLYLHPHIKGCVSHLGVGICTLLLAGCPVVRGTLTLPVCFCMGNRTFHPLAVDASWVSDQYHKQGYCQAGFSASFTSVSLHGNKPRHLVSTMVLGLLLICIYVYLRSATQLLLVVWK